MNSSMFCAPGAWRPGQTPHRIMHHAAMPQRHIALLALGLGGEMPLHGLDGNEVGHHGHGDGDTQKKKQKQCRAHLGWCPNDSNEHVM